QFFQSAWSVYASQTLSTGALKCLLTSMCCIGAASPLPLRCRPARRHRDERGNALHVVAVARPARGAALVEQRYADEHEHHGDGGRSGNRPQVRIGGEAEQRKAPPERRFAEVIRMPRVLPQ